MQPQGQDVRSTGRADGRGLLAGGSGDAECPLSRSRAVGYARRVVIWIGNPCLIA